MQCPVCKGDMWDNSAKKTNPKAPDYRCKDETCKYQWDKVSKAYVVGEYVTASWKPKEEFAKPSSQQGQSLNEQKFDKSLNQDLEQEKWDKIAWGKCKHAYLVEFFKSDTQNTVLTPDMEQIVEKWADASMRRLTK